MSFSTATKAYGSFSTSSIYMNRVDPGPVTDLARARMTLDTELKNGSVDLEGTVRILYFLQYRLSTSILPPSHPTLGLNENLDELASHREEFAEGTRVERSIQTAISAIVELLGQEESVLGRAVIDLLGDIPAADRAVVVRDARTVADTSTWLEQVGYAAPVFTGKQLRGISAPETLICVGTPNLFPDALWSASRSESTCWVSYPFGANRLPDEGLFGDEGQLTLPKWRTSGFDSRIDDVDPIDADEGLLRAAIRHRALAPRTGDETLPAALLLLSGGFAVWTSAESGAFMWSISVDDDDAATVGTTRVSAIRPGSVVIFRSQGAASEIVRSLADSNFGAAKHRGTQAKWKKELGLAVAAAGGVTSATSHLIEHGATTTNLEYWMRDTSIRPNSRQDFDATCRFAGIKDADDVWAALSRINRAHLKAGQHVRKQLNAALIENGAGQLISEGHQVLDIPGLGTLSAYRVIYRHPTTEEVDIDMLDLPFLAEEHGWPE